MPDTGAGANTLSEDAWEDLLYHIHEKKCTPFIGAGACAGTLPTASALAKKWAKKWKYPLTDSDDLARVAQYLSIRRYGMFPKERVKGEFPSESTPDFAEKDEPHGVLADLKLPIYITTNYDDFMLQALKSRECAPQRDYCRWNDYDEVIGEISVLESGFKPEPAMPLVYHLHGYCDLPQSMVLTEDDYLDFLLRFSTDKTLLPPVIRKALAGTSLLFVGYSLRDWNFRVLMRSIAGHLGANLNLPTVAIQLPPGDLKGAAQKRAQEYLTKYFETIQLSNVKVYWGPAREFAAELRTRWEKEKK